MERRCANEPRFSFKAGARGVRNGDGCNACFCSAGRFGEAGIAGTGLSLYRSLKSFDRVFEIISSVLTTTPDLAQAYLRLSKWRMAAWRFQHLLREGREDDAIENWEIAERERHEWFGWLQRDGGLAYRVLDSNAFQGQPIGGTPGSR